MKTSVGFKIFNGLKNVCAIVGIMGFLLFASAIDTEGKAGTIVFIGALVSVGICFCSMLFEYIMINHYNEDCLNSGYESLFLWNNYENSYEYDDWDDEDDEYDDEYEEENEFLDAYYEWLDENNYVDTEKTYNYYCKYIA